MSTPMIEHNEMNWIEPTQTRSREKVARILEATRSTIIETGSAHIKMTEIAQRSEVAVGTLYQFFPSSTALIGKLFATEMEPVDLAFQTMLSDANSFDDLLDGIDFLLVEQLKILKARPALLTIWSSTGIHPDIEQADFTNTVNNANLLADKLTKFFDNPARIEDFRTVSMLICHLWSGVIRLAMADKERDPNTYLNHYTSMIRAYAMQLAV